METKGRDETRYSDEPVPLRDYAGLVALFNVALAGGLAAAERSGRPLPARLTAGDVVLLSIATHKLSRLITKDRVMAFARAPFTRYQGDAERPSEVSASGASSGPATTKKLVELHVATNPCGSSISASSAPAV